MTDLALADSPAPAQAANPTLSGPGALSAPLADVFAKRGTPPPSRDAMASAVDRIHVAPEIKAAALAILESQAGYEAIRDEAIVYKRGNAAERLAFYIASRFLDPQTDQAHRRLLEAADEAPSPLDGLTIDPDSGVLLTRPEGWSALDEAVDEAELSFDTAMNTEAAINPGKTFMSTAKIVGSAMDSKIMALGSHPSVLRLLGRYLEGLPILYRINLIKSSNEYLQDGSSQFFHIDPEDFRQQKIFLMITDVDEDSGPLHLLRADHSDRVRVARGHRHNRLKDADVLDVVGESGLTRCTGLRGTMAIGDTSRCFHFGSRPGARERMVVMFQYITPFACSFALDAREASSKYALAVRDREQKLGMTISERDRRLFGLER